MTINIYDKSTLINKTLKNVKIKVGIPCPIACIALPLFIAIAING